MSFDQSIAVIIGAFLTGGIGAKLVDRFYSKTDHKQTKEISLAGQYLAENTRFKADLLNRVDALNKEVNTWRDRYGIVFNEAQDGKDAYRSLKRDYEELKDIHTELTAMHEQLKQARDRREKDYEELRLKHENLLHTCNDLTQEISRSKQEITRFEKQINKDLNEVRKEVGAATSV